MDVLYAYLMRLVLVCVMPGQQRISFKFQMAEILLLGYEMNDR